MERASVSPMSGVEIEFVADASQGRQSREALAETLHAAAFVIDSDDERGSAHRVDIGHQPGELLGGGMVAREQDD